MHRSQLENTAPPAGGPHRAAIFDDGRLAVAALAPPAALATGMASPSAAAMILFFTLYLAVAAVVLRSAARAGVLVRFGWANRITWLRAALTVVIASMLIDAGGGAVSWWTIGALAALALALDGLDGLVARRHGRSSRFGALFDQETDAALILVLCLLLGVSGKIGLWIVAMGALRYVFLAAGWIWPVLGRPLPPSTRRSAVCAVQVAALLVSLLPPVGPFTAAWISGGALVMLVLSFARDVLWLLRQPQPEMPS